MKAGPIQTGHVLWQVCSVWIGIQGNNGLSATLLYMDDLYNLTYHSEVSLF